MKHLKTIVFIFIIFTVVFGFNIVVYAIPMKKGYEELTPVVSFINFLIGVMRWGSASVAGIIATVLGWRMIMNVNADASQIAKKGLKNVVWGMFFIFCGSFIVDFFVSKFFSLIGG